MKPIRLAILALSVSLSPLGATAQGLNFNGLLEVKRINYDGVTAPGSFSQTITGGKFSFGVNGSPIGLELHAAQNSLEETGLNSFEVNQAHAILTARVGPNTRAGLAYGELRSTAMSPPVWRQVGVIVRQNLGANTSAEVSLGQLEADGDTASFGKLSFFHRGFFGHFVQMTQPSINGQTLDIGYRHNLTNDISLYAAAGRSDVNGSITNRFGGGLTVTFGGKANATMSTQGTGTGTDNTPFDYMDFFQYTGFADAN